MLPNFCRGRGGGARNNFDKNADSQKPTIKSGVSGITANSNKITTNLLSQDDKLRLQNLNDGYLPGTDPSYGLNQEIPPPDGKPDFYSNTGAEGRYKDTKNLYEDDYLTIINLGVGILISLIVIAKKG